MQGLIFAEGDFLVCVEALDATFFVEEARKPNILIGVGVSQGFKKRGGAIAMKVNGANKGSNQVKGSRHRGRWRPNERM